MTAIRQYQDEDELDDLDVVPPLHLVPRNPAALAWSATMPYELAMRRNTIREICEAYKVSYAEWQELRVHPLFIADCARATEELRKDGASFALKAQLQAEALLDTTWKFIHDSTTPRSVAADLAKFTIRAAGRDASARAVGTGGGNGNLLQINIDLSGK